MRENKLVVQSSRQRETRNLKKEEELQGEFAKEPYLQIMNM